MTPGMRRLCASVLAMEAIVFLLVIPVAISVGKTEPALAAAVGGGLGVACVVVAGLLKHRWAYVAGTLLQVAAIATGVLTSVMFVLGVIFALLWAGAILVARRVEGATRR